MNSGGVLPHRRLPGAVFVASALTVAFVLSLAGGEEDDDEVRLVVEDLVERLDASTDALPEVLRDYNRIEASTRLDLFERYRVHTALLRELRKRDDPVLVETARSFLGRSDTDSLPAQVLLLKAMRSSRFPMPRRERVALLGKTAYARNDRLAMWAVHTLGDGRWPEAVDELIRILKAEEASGRYHGLLFGVVEAELYRLLGAKSSPSGAAKTEKNWHAMGKKLPRHPQHSPRQGGKSVFFGDRVGPRSVFCIDISSSMKQKVVIRGATRAEPKIEVVKRELASALSGLDVSQRFNIVSYDATPEVWRGGSSARLVTARPSVVRSAVRFAEGLEAGSGTNIHDSMVAALSVPDVESVYLLSDGAPSIGGGPEDIVRRVTAMNYLLGVRIITYGIGDAAGSYDDALMKRLARENWGWYRRLD